VVSNEFIVDTLFSKIKFIHQIETTRAQNESDLENLTNNKSN